MKKVKLGLTVLLILLFLTQCTPSESEPHSLTTEPDNTPLPPNEELPIESNQSQDSIRSEIGQAQYEDYIQACQLFSTRYIYLEDKLGCSRDSFLKNQMDYAQQLTWTGDKNQFRDELIHLASMFNDGHVGLFFVGDYRQAQTVTLGFIPTKTLDDKYMIQYVDEKIADLINVGDEIISWNGKPISDEVTRLSLIRPNSTTASSLEHAARRLAIDYAFDPLRSQYSPVNLVIQTPDHHVSQLTLDWYSCGGYTDYNESNSDNELPLFLMTHSLIPSLEDIPDDVNYTNEELMYYFRTSHDHPIAVLHPRSFYHWTQEDLDQVMANILENNPDLLIIDLKDTSGGYFDQVIYLSHALNVTDPFEFEYDVIDAETGIRSQGTDSFSEIEDTITLSHVWKGKVLFRINSIVQSGGDYFTRWMQLNNEDNRFLFIGQDTSGAGGGSDSFTLNHTQTQLNLPLRDRKIKSDSQSIEGHAVNPDIPFDQSIDVLIQDEIVRSFIENN